LDPPDANGAEAGRPQLDEDYLILSTIHSAKGQEWDAVFVLNPVDGCIPSAAPQVRQKGPFKGQISRFPNVRAGSGRSTEQADRGPTPGRYRVDRRRQGTPVVDHRCGP
jgi:superfamily I DNA/RNA helicase